MGEGRLYSWFVENFTNIFCAIVWIITLFAIAYVTKQYLNQNKGKEKKTIFFLTAGTLFALMIVIVYITTITILVGYI